MLTPGQKRYLDSLDASSLNRIVKVKQWNREAFEMGEGIVVEVKQALPNLEVKLNGSLALGIAGEEDVDIQINCPKTMLEKYSPILDKLFGKIGQKFKNHIAWQFYRNGVHVGAWLVDVDLSPSANASRKLEELYESKPELIKEYENIKLAMDGKTYQEYQTAKYEFYNKTLGLGV